VTKVIAHAVHFTNVHHAQSEVYSASGRGKYGGRYAAPQTQPYKLDERFEHQKLDYQRRNIYYRSRCWVLPQQRAAEQ
jgi:hypothetical protein